MQRNPVTPEGYEALVAALKREKEIVRPGIVRDIEEARAHGDISENSEYEDAKERQALCEGRIQELENRVAAAEIIDVKKLQPSERVVFGTTVLLENADTGEVDIERTLYVIDPIVGVDAKESGRRGHPDRTVSVLGHIGHIETIIDPGPRNVVLDSRGNHVPEPASE